MCEGSGKKDADLSRGHAVLSEARCFLQPDLQRLLVAPHRPRQYRTAPGDCVGVHVLRQYRTAPREGVGLYALVSTGQRLASA
eukprot:2497038-Rhodomonas_salina.2